MANLKEVFRFTSKRKVGFTTATLRKNELLISHGGNMGNSIETSVNPNLQFMGLPTVEELKKEYTVLNEDGSPDMMWGIKLKIK